ncbi:YdeI family protein [Halobacillus sp. MO56]
MTNRNSKVDELLSKSQKWKEEFEQLRRIILTSGLTEEVKWGNPCYTLENKNIVLIHGFKEYCALLFFKGALLKDKHDILIQQTENVQAGRQIRFTNVEEIKDNESILKDYILEAIEVEKAGLEVKVEKKMEIPAELQQKFGENPALKTAFEGLTPGRQRAYILYFSKAKKTETRTSRIEKYTPHILDGKGLNDK